MKAHDPIDAKVTWAMGFQFDATADGKVLKLLNIIAKYSREYLATTLSSWSASLIVMSITIG